MDTTLAPEPDPSIARGGPLDEVAKPQ